MSKSGDEKQITAREAILLGAALLVVSGAVATWIIGSFDFLEGLGIFGVGVTVASLLLAVMIFANQKRSHDAFAKKVLEKDEKKAAARTAEETPDAGADTFAKEAELMEGLGRSVSGARGVLRYARDDVPLRLVAELVQAWQRDGRDGEWKIGSLYSVLRRQGQGNNAWRFVFHDGERVRIFKLARGGQGKTESTVVEEE